MTVVLVISGQEKLLALKSCISCPIHRSAGCTESWTWAVWCCVSGEVSCFNTDGHLGMRVLPQSASCCCIKQSLESKNCQICIYACLCYFNLPLCTSFSQTRQERVVVHAAWMDRLALQKIWPEAIVYLLKKCAICGRSMRRKLMTGL